MPRIHLVGAGVSVDPPFDTVGNIGPARVAQIDRERRSNTSPHVLNDVSCCRPVRTVSRPFVSRP